MSASSHGPGPHVTYKDIAERCGVSLMTVSRVLRNRGHVAQKTREKVMEAAETLGYRPNPLVQALMSGVRQRNVSHTANLAWTAAYDLQNPHSTYLTVMLDAARVRASRLGFGLEVLPLLDDKLTSTSVHRMLHARGVVGVVVPPLMVPGTKLPLPWDAFPYATIGRSLVSPRIHYTMSHFQHNMERVLEEVTRLGYKRVAFLEDSYMDQRQDHAAAMVFEHYLSQCPARNQVRPVVFENWDSRAVDAWLKKEKPDVVVSGSNRIYEMIRQTGRTFPGDLGFATLSWRESRAECAGIRQPFAELGAAAVDMVVAQIHRNEHGLPPHSKAMLLEGDWVEGQTLRPQAASRT